MSETDTNTQKNTENTGATEASEELKSAQQTTAEGGEATENMGEEPNESSNVADLNAAKEDAAKEDAAKAEKDPVDEWREKVTYLAAEMENMKKRFVRERGELMKMANEELIKGILPVFDNLDLALKSIRESEKKEEEKGEGDGVVANLLKGVDMTLVHFQQTLDRLGVKTVESEGKPFDPAVHEAMGQSTDENYDDGVVTSEFQKGFTLHGRVIRPAKVIVNKISKA